MGKKDGRDLPIGQCIALERGDPRQVFAEVHRVSRNKYRWRVLQGVGFGPKGYTTTLNAATRAAATAAGR